MNNSAGYNKSRDRRDLGPGTGDAGYTLVELLVVLAIVALIAAIVAPRVLNYLGGAKTESARIQIKNIGVALELYYLDNGEYPSDEQGLKALSDAPAQQAGWNGPYLKNVAVLVDPWGHPYTYHLVENGAEISVRSLGKDGKVGGTGEDADIP